MKRISFPLVYFLLALAICILSACGNQSPEIIKIDPHYREYVSGYTSGMVERDAPIKLELVDPIPDDISDKELQKYFTISPQVSGELVKTGERTLEFVPKGKLPSGQFFTATFELDEFAKVKDGYEEFKFQFSTFQQEIDVYVTGLESYNRHEIRYQKLEGSLETRDFIEEKEVRKTLEVLLDGKPIAYKLEVDYGNEYEFVVDSIERTNKAQLITVRWDGTAIRSEDEGSRLIKVPALDDFSVIGVNTFDDDDQYIEVRFGDPLKLGQSLEGIIRLEDKEGNRVKGLTFDIDFNVVRVYLPNRLTGDYFLKCDPGIRNTADAKMKKAVDHKVFLEAAKPKVRLIGSGAILPNSQGLIFPFEAVALKAVDVRIIKIYEKNVQHFLQVNDLNGDDELSRFGKIIAENKVRLDSDKSLNLNQWNRHVIDLEKWIKAEPGAIYQVAIRFNKSYSTCECNKEKEQDFEKTASEGWTESDWHTWGFDGYSSWGGYDSRSACDDAYYYGTTVQRNILASNIGMMFKLEVDKKSTAFLTDMITANPLPYTEVAYYDYVGKLIIKGTTNSEGMFTTKLKRKPFLMISKSGKQRGYLKLADGHANSLSKFDISGENVQEGIKGFLYTERGVWRPGDSIYVNFMLQDKKNKLPDNHPVNFELKDPSGNTLYDISRNTHVNGIYSFRVATNANGKTGNYEAQVVVGNYTYTKLLKVETIKPNRLKIYLDTDDANLNDSSQVRAEWLHGAKANGLKAKVELQLRPMRTGFKNFKGYTFDSPIRSGGYEEHTVFEGKLDGEGAATFSNAVTDVSEASGMLRANYITKVYEKGGDFSIDRKVSTYSPYDSYVGFKTPKGSIYDRTLETAKEHKFSFVAVDKKGNLRGKRKIHLRIYKMDETWWYSGNRNVTAYNYRESAVLFRDTILWTYKGKKTFNYSVPKYEYGNYLIVATDVESGHETGEVVRFDWSYWSRANRSDASKATMLTFSTDKDKYAKGETVRLSIPSPSNGRALVSVETSDRIVKKFWIETKQGETVHEFVTTADMAPNAFLHVTMIQPHNSTANDLPIRMYGVMPIFVDDPYTHLKPTISMKDEVRPESTASIKVSEENGRKMSYTLAIVDDGLLDLTHFQTPQPWNTFYAKEALGVQTWDMYDDVLGAYSGSLDHLLSVGGGAGAIVGNGPKANRFPPMVRFLGPFELPAGGSKTHTVDIPSYIGSVRVMVVARDKESYGNAQKTVKVKKPLMVLATMPRVLGPGEEFSLPVDVFAMEKNIKNVKVTIETNGMFESSNSKSKSIEFTKEGDELVDFKLKTKDKIGMGKVKIKAVCGNEVATQEIEIDIRPSNPYTFETQQFQLEGGASANAEVLFDGLIGSQEATISVSTVPQMNLEKRLKYLVHYPHGCVEQTTSAVFPQLYLTVLEELTKEQRDLINYNVQAGIERLQLFQNYEGGFSYWPGQSGTNEWGTNYGGHFLLEAEHLGYKLPPSVKERWIEYQKDRAAEWSDSHLGNGAELTQAYRLYLLALAGSPDVGAMNRLKEKDGLSTAAGWRLATAYAQIGQLETAKEMTSKLNTYIPVFTELTGTFGSEIRDRAIILEAQTLLKQKQGATESMNYLAQKLRSEEWLSTQETAYSLIAIGRFAKGSSSAESSKLSLTVDGNAESKTVGKKLVNFRLKEKAGKRSLVLKNTGNAPVFVTVTTRKIPKVGNEKNKFSRLKASVNYQDMDGKRLDPTKIKQGTEFYALVELHNISKMNYNEMALNQIFPSGWEVYNSRMFGGASAGTNVDYQDIRDDRILSYYSLRAQEKTTIKVRLHATYKGKFYLPGLYTEAMYDHTIHAQRKGQWVEVI
ncbi:MAG: MG2 domain-containing protein [Crocinitomicaceae bacterium]